MSVRFVTIALSLFGASVAVAEPCVPATPTVSSAHRVFEGRSSAVPAECHRLARAQSLLLRRADQAAGILSEIEESLGSLNEVRWLKGRIALRSGQLAESFGLLAPQGKRWPTEPLTLWDYAIVAAATQKDVAAIEAYERLLQTNRLEPRERVAVRLELAVVLSRGNEPQRSLARELVAELSPQELDPDSRPWVQAVKLFLHLLEPSEGDQVDAVPAGFFHRYQQGAKGSRDVFGGLGVTDRWLHLAPNEHRAVVALAIKCVDEKAVAQLWSAVNAPAESLLARLKQRAQAAICKGGRGGGRSAKASLAPSPS